MLIIINQDLKLLLCNNIVEEKILFFIKIILNQIVCFYRILKKIYFCFCSLEKFRFESHRHNSYPFALTLYVNGLIDSRISVCCEYKHKRNVPLGGPHGLFAISDVQKVKPCRRFVNFIH